MLRRIVLMRGREPLHTAWSARSFSVAAETLSKTAKTGGVNFDESYHPVRVPGRARNFSSIHGRHLDLIIAPWRASGSPRPGLRKPSLLQRERLMLCARILRIRKPSNG